MVVTVRCSKCKTIVTFTGETRSNTCQMFECCSDLNVSTIMLNGSVKRCGKCGLDVKLKTTYVTLMAGVEAK